MNKTYQDSTIWKNSLDPKGDKNDVAREKLRQSFASFHKRVGELVETIASDMTGLTVHNLSHLDALWEMADILTGGDYELNPAETYVLGGAILLHDSAMTYAAYPGGIAEIKDTPEYKDVVSLINKAKSQNKEIQTDDIERIALSETLRIKHAAKSEELSSQKWISPLDGSSIYLIDDSDLRDHYSTLIGKIAHSHHWNTSQLPKEFDISLGAFSSFPADWTVDPLKVALVLRCIDAMQVDDRRAPTFLAAIREIGSESLEHWSFQNKLALPHLDERRIVYTSKSPFTLNQATAWHLCFDTLQMIDKELRNANELHSQRGLKEFRATSVAGSSSSDALAKHIEVTGWRPLPLNLKVSDVPKLAKTLGGKDLYNNPLAPLRELIQNAADAVDARSAIDKDFTVDDGLIFVRFIESKDSTTLEIEDNGVGMSEHVLTKALLDFGFSFWSSADARKEFPGLQANSEKFRGKYGIGFFSVFMWSEQITVCSRIFSEGQDKTRVLEFRHGVESRPILRDATTAEKSSKYTTKVSIILTPETRKNFESKESVEEEYFSYHSQYYRRNIIPSQIKDWPQKLKLLCGALNIKVMLELNGASQAVSLPNWRDCSNKEFIDFFKNTIFSDNLNTDRFSTTLTSLSKLPPLGGRCFISPYSSSEKGIAIYDKGIFVCFAGRSGVSGLVLSNVTNAARDRFSSDDISLDKAWVDSVRIEAFRASKNLGEKIALQQLLATIDKPDQNQPLFIRNRDLISLAQLKGFISDEGVFHIRLNENTGEKFNWSRADKIEVITGLQINESRVYPLIEYSGSVDSSDDLNSMFEESNKPLFIFLREIRDHLGEGTQFKSEFIERSGYQNDCIDITLSIQNKEV